VLLDSQLKDEFYMQKIKLNPSKDPTSNNVFEILKKMVGVNYSRGHKGVILLKTHYVYNGFDNVARLKKFLVSKNNVKRFLLNDVFLATIVFSTTNTLFDEPIILSQPTESPF